MEKDIKKENLTSFYQAIRNRLKNYYSGSDIWIISGNKEAMDHIGLHPSKKMTVYNGAIECKFHLFSIYDGSKKGKKNIKL